MFGRSASNPGPVRCSSSPCFSLALQAAEAAAPTPPRAKAGVPHPERRTASRRAAGAASRSEAPGGAGRVNAQPASLATPTLGTATPTHTGATPIHQTATPRSHIPTLRSSNIASSPAPIASEATPPPMALLGCHPLTAWPGWPLAPQQAVVPQGLHLCASLGLFPLNSPPVVSPSSTPWATLASSLLTSCDRTVPFQTPAALQHKLVGLPSLWSLGPD